MNPVVVSGVWKRYQIGLTHHSLRDALSGLLSFRRGTDDPAAQQEEGILWALRDVSFEVARGETLGIIGRNGAGKSTILKLLSGISKQTKGSVQINGKLAALIEVGAGFHPDLTGRENIDLNGTILGLRRHEIRKLFDRIVAFSELERFIDTPVKRYSSGMYVRLGFAIAAHVNPDILLIDEVLSVGDLAFQQKCLQRVHELKQAGTTMIFISHNLNAIERICDRAIMLQYGRVLADGDVSQVIGTYRDTVVTAEQRRWEKADARQSESGVGGEVRIDAVQVRNGAGQITETFQTGDALTVEVAFTCSRRIERPSVTIGIDRVDGVVCHVAASQREENHLPALEGRGTIVLTYPAMNLLPSGYRISVEISEANRPVPLDSRKHGCFFSITSDQYEGGVAHFDHYWEVSPTYRPNGTP